MRRVLIGKGWAAQWPCWLAIILAILFCGTAAADTVYVDARNGTGLTSGVTDSAFSNSAATCGSAESRYAFATSAWSQVKPTLGVAGGYYDVQVAHSGNTFSNISGSLLTNITLTDATAISGDAKAPGYTDKWQGGASPYNYQNCTYYSVGIIKLGAGVTVPTIRFAYRSGAISGSSRWNVYGWRFVQVTGNTLTVNASPAAGGTVTGAGSYIAGTSVTVTATQSDGYEFVRWTDGAGAQVSASSTYAFSMPASAYTLNAEFRTATARTLSLVAVPSDAASSLTGAGSYEPGTQVSPSAAASVGYTLSKWSTNSAGGDTVALPYSMPTVSTTLYAIFTQNLYTLTRFACTGGSVSGSSGSLVMGTPVTVTAAPNPGYAFIGWTTDGCSGTAFLATGPSYSFIMPPSNVNLTAIFGKAKLIEGFESYASGGVSFDSIDKNDSAGPNQSANGSDRPWWGPNPPNGRVHSANAHFGSKSLWGTAGNCKDLVNLQSRLNSGTAFTGEVYLDWWFYDPLGQGGTTTDFCGDYSALSYYSGIPAGADYPTPMPNPMAASIQQLAIGMSDDLSAGYDPSKYQVRVQGDTAGYHNGWFNTGAVRSVGWHHARIIVGPRKVTNTNDVTFYVDNMAVPAVGPRDSITTSGYNIIEAYTAMPAAGTCDSPDGCRYSKYLHFSSVDDFSFGDAPGQPGSAPAGSVGTDRIRWNWLDGSRSEDGFEIWNAATTGGLVTWTGQNATTAQETGLSANTQYSRWVDAYLSQYCGSISSSRTPLQPTCTLALAPVYGASGNAAIVCSNGQGGTTTHLTGTATTFTAVNGFGAGPARASRYQYVWNNSAASPSDWTGAAEWTSGSLTKTPSAAGSYYLHLRACNGDGVANTTTLNLGPYVYQEPISVGRISDAWAYDDGQVMMLTGKAVTAALPSDSFWIEESDRTAGMRVLYPATSGVWQGHAVTIIGALDSSVRPRAFVATNVEDLGVATPKITPLGVVLRSLGGIGFNSKTPSMTIGVGQYNVGLLVRAAGKVSFSDNTDPSNRFFYIDDGSAVASNGHAGVKVKCGAVDAPTSGAVTVTGIISLEQSGGIYVPVLIRVSVD